MPSSKSKLTALVVSAASFGCTSLSSTSGGSTASGVTAIIIDPAAFVGDVPCGPGPGELKRYVATLIDVTENLDSGTSGVIPSSPPSPCFKQVLFQRTADLPNAPDGRAVATIQDGHEYIAEIDGYDTDALQAESPGSPTLRDASGTKVLPRWTASCGRDTESGDGGPDASTPPRTDAGTGYYGSCRTELLPDGHASGDLSGPVCAFEGLTLVMRHCTPLRPR